MNNVTTSEALVIGAVANNPDYLLELSDLKSEMFSVPNRYLYSAIKLLYKNQANQIDVADIWAVIEPNENQVKLLNQLGGIEYIEELMVIGSDKGIGEVTTHAQSIIDQAFKNEMSETLSYLESYVSTSKEPRNEVSKNITDRILDVKSKYLSGNKIELIGTKTDKIIHQLELNSRNNGLVGLPTFSELLNKYIGGYKRQELIVYAGKAKSGKSQMVINESYRLCVMGGIPALVLDTELSDETFVVRMLARMTGYNFRYIETGQWVNDEQAKAKVLNAKEQLDNSKLCHTYISGWDLDKIYNEVKRVKLQYGVALVFFDYIKAETIDGRVQEHQLLGMYTDFLKNRIAGELDLACVAFAQMSDYSDGGYRLANSQKIKNYSSATILLIEKNQEQFSRDYEDLGGNYFVIVQYNRNGVQMPQDNQDMGININFDKSCGKYTQAQYQCKEIENLVKDID